MPSSGEDARASITVMVTSVSTSQVSRVKNTASFHTSRVIGVGFLIAEFRSNLCEFHSIPFRSFCEDKLGHKTIVLGHSPN